LISASLHFNEIKGKQVPNKQVSKSVLLQNKKFKHLSEVSLLQLWMNWESFVSGQMFQF